MFPILSQVPFCCSLQPGFLKRTVPFCWSKVARVSLVLVLTLFGWIIPGILSLIGVFSSVFCVCNNLFFPIFFYHRLRRLVIHAYATSWDEDLKSLVKLWHTIPKKNQSLQHRHIENKVMICWFLPISLSNMNAHMICVLFIYNYIYIYTHDISPHIWVFP